MPVELLGRLRSDRVLRRPALPRVYDLKGGRPSKRGGEFVFGGPVIRGVKQAVTVADARLCAKAAERV